MGQTFVHALWLGSKRTSSEIKSETEKICYMKLLRTIKAVVNSNPSGKPDTFDKDFQDIEESKEKGLLYRYIENRYKRRPDSVVFNITFNEDILQALKKCISSDTIGVGIVTAGDSKYVNMVPKKLKKYFLGGFSFVKAILSMAGIDVKDINLVSAVQPCMRKTKEDFPVEEQPFVVMKNLNRGKLCQLEMIVKMLDIETSKFKILLLDDSKDNVVGPHLPSNVRGFHYRKGEPEVTSKIMDLLESLSLGDETPLSGDESPPSGDEGPSLGDEGDDINNIPSDDRDKEDDDEHSIFSAQQKAFLATADNIPSDSDEE